MDSRSKLVNGQVRDVLKPFVKYQKDWLLHYPVYLNSFCFTYDLASLLASGGKGAPDSLEENFLRHDWWTGLPHFSYRKNIEIFVAVNETIQLARDQGHHIPPERCIRFTGYDLKSVFYPKKWKNGSKPKKWLFVTDIRSTCEQLLSAWRGHPPPWLPMLGDVELIDENIRWSCERELHDLFTNDGKIYVFSAPMAYVLRERKDKYQEEQAGVAPIDTYYVFRCNSGVSPAKICELTEALSTYYSLMLDSGRPQDYLHPKAPADYGRIASTIGQPHPFHEIHNPEPQSPAARRKNERDMRKRYAKILADHHRP